MNITPEIKLEPERRARQIRDVYERLRLCVILSRSEGMLASVNCSSAPYKYPKRL